MIGAAQGAVRATHGGLVDVRLPSAAVGAGVRLAAAGRMIPGRVVAVMPSGAMVAAFGPLDGVAAGAAVVADASATTVWPATALLGRAIDALGAPLDGGAPPAPGRRASDDAPAPADRCAVRLPFVTGIRAIDGPLAFGRGARIGIFGGPGCGKSTLLEQIVAGADADAVVVGLIGERGREAERWIAMRPPHGAIVCATSDRSAGERVRAAEVAFAQADALRRRGLHVLLVLDSLARTAAAARDLALAAGEPVGRGGYPPSVFHLLARLLERAGAFTDGSITLVATVLSDGPESADPVSEACRAALDGHLVLAERLARAGWFPAIDVPASTSRTLGDIAPTLHRRAAARVRRALALLDETRDARALGLDPGAGDPLVRAALAAQPQLAAFLQQSEPADRTTTLNALLALADRLHDGHSV